jgi:phage baseplate assembly protein gpV
MRKIVRLANVSLLAGAVCLATASADTPKSKSPSTPPAKSTAAPVAKSSAAPAKTKMAKPMAHTAVGTLESYDAAGKTVTVKGAKSTWTFNAADARVWDGSKSVGLDDLSSHTGGKVTVKYTENGDQKSATSIRLTTSHHAKAKS